MPKPFKRPSIDLGGPKKEWREIDVWWVREGDIVRDLGMVASTTIGGDSATEVRLSFLSGNRVWFGAEEKVIAFVEVDRGRIRQS